jgi:hypothetical protein
MIFSSYEEWSHIAHEYDIEDQNEHIIGVIREDMNNDEYRELLRLMYRTLSRKHPDTFTPDPELSAQ